MIKRFEFRGCLKSDSDEQKLNMALKAAEAVLKEKIKEKELLELCLYRHESMLFLYIEAFTETVEPEELLKPLNPLLEKWPEEQGLSYWAYMYPVYFQSIPKDDEKAWTLERSGNKTKVGRIAWLKHETMFEYVYWHKAITDEGLLKGDKYQFISLHEDILFSYYEEPRNNVNILEKEGESLAIEGWKKADPGAHFDQIKAKGSHFLVIEPILIAD